MEPDEYSYSSPSVDLEKKLPHLKVSTQWKMPDGMSYGYAQHKLHLLCLNMTELMRFSRQVIDLNRDLSNMLNICSVLVDKSHKNGKLKCQIISNYIMDIAVGAINQFNVDDIYFFVTTNRYNSDDHKFYRKKMLKYMRLMDKVDPRICWLPSPSTLEKIASAKGICLNVRPSKRLGHLTNYKYEPLK